MGMFRRVLSVVPETVTYGLAGRRVLSNKISGFFQKADSGEPDNSKNVYKNHYVKYENYKHFLHLKMTIAHIPKETIAYA